MKSCVISLGSVSPCRDDGIRRLCSVLEKQAPPPPHNIHTCARTHTYSCTHTYAHLMIGNRSGKGVRAVRVLFWNAVCKVRSPLSKETVWEAL